MASLDQLSKAKVFVPRDPGKGKKLDGTPQAPKRVGKVHHLVFSPDGKTVVGVMVKRPDVAGMVKRNDMFAALDSISFTENGILVSGPASTDKDAIDRLGIDFDKCIIWEGMDVVTRSGKVLGYVVDVTFDLKTGAVETIYVTDGAVAASLVGSVPIPASMILGYRKGNMVVSDDAAELSLTGGAAAKAGESFAKAKIAGKEAAHEAGKAASVAVDKGSFALGKGIGHVRNVVKDAMTEDPEVAELPAQDVTVEAPASPETPASAEKDDAPVPVYVPSGTTSDDGTEDKPDVQAGVDKAARAVGRQIGKTKGMFSSFLKEFEENSK
jgi:uncharacterized protein YrrD